MGIYQTFILSQCKYNRNDLEHIYNKNYLIKNTAYKIILSSYLV